MDTESDQQRIKALEAELKQFREISDLEILTTTDHRPILLKAMREAHNDLILVSAFINKRAFDQEVCNLLVDAICKRRVHVRIAWGLGTHEGPDVFQTRRRGEAIQQHLEKRIRKTDASRLGLLQMKRLETHQKFIVCDDRFCAWGSFNWLSYRGDRDRGFRQESSTLSQRPNDIELWRQAAGQLFGER